MTRVQTIRVEPSYRSHGLDLCQALNDFLVVIGSVAAVMNAAVTGRAREILSAIGADGMGEVYRARHALRATCRGCC